MEKKGFLHGTVSNHWTRRLGLPKSGSLPLLAKWFTLMVTARICVLISINVSSSLMMLANYVWLLPPVLLRIKLVKKGQENPNVSGLNKTWEYFFPQNMKFV